jgi:hypothetical protein
MARPHHFPVTAQGKVQSWFVPAGTTGPRIEVRRQHGLRPIVTVDGLQLTESVRGSRL